MVITVLQRRRGFTHLTGVDYVQGAVDLAQGVLAKEGFTDVDLQVRTYRRGLGGGGGRAKVVLPM